MNQNEQILALQREVEFYKRQAAVWFGGTLFWFMATIVVACLLLASQAKAQEEVVATRIATPYEAIQAASVDILSVPELSRPDQMYFWVMQPTPERIGAYQYSFNLSLSYASVPLTAKECAGDLLRIDLKKWCPEPDKYNRVSETINSYVDPYFYQAVPELRQVPRYKHENGVWYTKKWVLTPQFAPCFDQAACKTLLAATERLVPIVRADRWLVKSLSVIDGGLYYKLRGFEGLNQMQWTALFGADEAMAEAFESSNFTVRWASEVTDMPRRGVAFYGVGVKPTIGIPIVTLTQDLAKESQKVEQHPIYNLREFDFDATEIFAVLPNGFPAAAIFDGAGNPPPGITVPDTIARDTTVLPPGDMRLQPIISCGRCHAPHEFWRPFPNDLQAMLSGDFGATLRPNVFADIARPGESPADVLDEIVGKYSGDLSDTLRIANNKHANVTFRVCRMSVTKVWEAITEIDNYYRHDKVTPTIACLELGYKTTPENAVATLERILPRLPPDEFGVSLEDPVAITLKKWTPDHPLAVKRYEWERVFLPFYSRVLENERLQKREERE